MGIIDQCLLLVPVPYLSFAFHLLRTIWLSIQQAQASKWQLEALAQSIAQILDTLNEQYRTGRLLKVKTSTPLKKLHECVKFILPRILLTKMFHTDYLAISRHLLRKMLHVCSWSSFSLKIRELLGLKDTTNALPHWLYLFKQAFVISFDGFMYWHEWK